LDIRGGWLKKVSLNKTIIRSHVYDKRTWTKHDEVWGNIVTSPWDHYSLRLTQTRARRLTQYFIWISFGTLSYQAFKFFVVRQRLNRVEKWDWQSKYWRDGYWVREFPEGMMVKEYSNGSYSIEPGLTPRPSLGARIMRRIMFIQQD